jgi:hypothetical protein
VEAGIESSAEKKEKENTDSKKKKSTAVNIKE